MGDSAVGIDFERVPEIVGPSLVEEVHRTLAGRAVGELEPKDLPAETRFQLSRAALGDNPSMVEHGDAVGQLVSLFEVLRGQQDRDTVIRQPAGRVPQLLAAARIEPGGRFVQEEQLRFHDHADRQIEPAAHAPRVRPDPPVTRVYEVEAGEQFVRPGPCSAAGKVTEAGHHFEVFLAAQQVVDRCVLAGEADRRFHPEPGRMRRSWPATLAVPESGRTKVAKMRTIVVLPAPFGPSRAKTDPASMARSTSSSTRLSPKDLLIPND